MNKLMFNQLMATMSKKSLTINEIIAFYHVENLYDFFDLVIEFINDNLEYLLDTDFFYSYHLFLYNLADIITDEEDIYAFKYLIDKTIKTIKSKIKVYHKNLKQKDEFYYSVKKVINEIKANRGYVLDLLSKFHESEPYQIVWFVMTKLKNADYLYRLIELHPEYVNLVSNNGNNIFIEFIYYYITNIKKFSDEDCMMYRRFIVLFLESDEFRLKNNELFSILEYLESSLISAKLEQKKELNFIINEIERHYDVINTDSRLNCVDYCSIDSPLEHRNPPMKKRVDLTDLFTFSIDSMRDNNYNNYLIDDAMSIVEKDNGCIDLYIHISDVDHFVKKDSDLDLFMRSIGETVYAKGYKKPMLDYSIANECSLAHGKIRPAISFVISLDSLGNVTDLQFMKTLVNVNFNLSKGYAEYFYKASFDETLKHMLHVAKRYAVLLRKKRGDTVGNLRISSLIMEESNILVNLAVADYFKNEGLLFPYKNYLGKRSIRNAKDVSLCEQFNRENGISENGRNILYSVFDIYNRPYYDIVSVGNKSFGGRDVGNVGNPLREYISLETDRLIKDILINGEKNDDYWEERIIRDCIEYTETSAKIKSLYGSNN